MRNPSSTPTLLVLLALLLAAVPAEAQKITRDGDRFMTRVVHQFDVSPGGELVMGELEGSVNVTSWDEGRVEVIHELWADVRDEAEAQEVFERMRSEGTRSGNTVRIEGARERDRWWGRNRTGQSFTVKVPRRFDVDVATRGGSIDAAALQGSIDLTTAGGSIDARDIQGPLDATTAGGSVEAINVNGDADLTTAGGSIEAEKIQGTLDATTAGGSIHVRDVQRDADLTTAGGGIEATGVGGNLDASTAGGSIEVERVQGSVDVSTAGGRIELRALAGRVEASTSGGDIRGEDLGGPVEVETSAGDIVLRGVRRGVEANTSVGDIEVELAGGDGFDGMELETTHGDITVVLPADLGARIDAEVERYDRRYDRNDIFSDFALSRNTEDDRSRTLRSSGAVNGGGPLIELRVSGGSIYIQRARTP